MAKRASVTVSMADEIRGMLSDISRVNCVRTSTCPGITSEAPGSSKTSSKVTASLIGGAVRGGLTMGLDMPVNRGR